MDNALDEHFNLLMNNDMQESMEEKVPLLEDAKDKSSLSFKNIIYWICVVSLVLVICVVIYYIMLKLFLITPSKETEEKEGKEKTKAKKKKEKKKNKKNVLLKKKIKSEMSEKTEMSELSDMSDISDISDMSDLSEISEISEASKKLNEFLRINKNISSIGGSSKKEELPLKAHYFNSSIQLEEIKSKSSNGTKPSIKMIDIGNIDDSAIKKSKRGRPKKKATIENINESDDAV